MSEAPDPRSSSPALRYSLLAAGWVLVALGALGVFLPLLPTTPFLLLAAWCFVRSSERVHRWLLASPAFGPYLRQWRERRTVPPDAKAKAVLLVVATIGSSIAFFVDGTRPRILLALVGLAVLTFLLRLPSERVAPIGVAPEERSAD